jgi:polyisoprenoid-binding protein YceI
LCAVDLASWTTAHGAIPSQSCLKAENGQVQFTATGRPGALKVIGKTGGPTGCLKINGDKLTGTLTVDVTQFATGIGMRDRHLKEKYLEVAKFPTATLTFSDLSLPKKALTDDGVFLVEGPAEIEIHGQNLPVTIKIEGKRTGTLTEITSQFDVKLSDFKITQPSFAGVSVNDLVRVEIQSKASVETK